VVCCGASARRAVANLYTSKTRRREGLTEAPLETKASKPQLALDVVGQRDGRVEVITAQPPYP